MSAPAFTNFHLASWQLRPGEAEILSGIFADEVNFAAWSPSRTDTEFLPAACSSFEMRAVQNETTSPKNQT